MVRSIDLRGAGYKSAMQEWIPVLKAEAEALLKAGGELTPLTVSQMAVRHNLPIKTAFQFLEYGEVLPSGTWERLASRGFTAKKAREAVEAASDG